MDLENYIDRYQLAFQKIYRSINNMVKQHVHSDVTTDQFTVLQFIHRNNEVTSTKIAQTMGVGKSSITAIINRLVEKQFISRHRNEDDRRIVYLQLTEQGRHVVQVTEKEIKQFIEEKLNHFDEKDIEKFLIAIERLSQLMENDEGE